MKIKHQVQKLTRPFENELYMAFSSVLLQMFSLEFMGPVSIEKVHREVNRFTLYLKVQATFFLK